MSLFNAVFNSDEYKNRHLADFDPVTRNKSNLQLQMAESCKTVLIRIVSRALFDVSNYPESDPDHVSARRWLMGEAESLLSFREIANMVDFDALFNGILRAAQHEGIDRKKVMSARKFLYRLDKDDGAGQLT